MSYSDKFEGFITRVLLVMMAGVVLLATVELGWLIGKDVLTPPLFLLEIEELLELFGQFLLVLIGIELMHSMMVYIESREIHLEAVLTVALIAMARKIVVLEPKDLPEGTLLGIAAIVLALTLGYYLVGRGRREKRQSDAETKR
ncbi:MAG: phosphate-starvation-inducible PsiE family protein [Gemmatimonadaceae bacterium]